MRRAGFSLMELLLALAMTVLVLGIVAGAIHVNLQLLDSRRGDIERSQIAAAVMRSIADDLRCAVQYGKVDLEGIEAVAPGDVTAELAGDDTGVSLIEAEPELDADAEEDPAADTSIADDEIPPEIPGLYGNQYELQVDVHRLPRLDEYETYWQTDPNEPIADVVSDVKTVAYFIDANRADDAPLSAGSADQLPGGLVRRERDRAVTLWSAENGLLDQLNLSGDLLAREVTHLEFRYFDGVEWLIEWDSAAEARLPVAVEILLSVTTIAHADEAVRGTLDEATIREEFGESVFRLIVHLPASHDTQSAELAEDDLEELGL